jgi:hypothetical protein
MATYPPPNEFGVVFNPIDWNTETGANITIDYLNANYLKFPIAQGLETFVGTNNQATTDCQDDIEMNTNKITGLANPTNAQDATTKNYVDNYVNGRTPVLTPSTTYTNSTITTNASGFISSVSAGTPPSASLPVYFGSIPSTNVATGLNGSVVVSVNSTSGQLDAGTWLMVAQVQITSSNGYGAYNSIPSGQGCFRVLSPASSLVFESVQAGTSFNNDIACGMAVAGSPYTYQYNSNITMNCIFTLTATSGFLNFNFTGGVDQNHLQANVILAFSGAFQVVKLA